MAIISSLSAQASEVTIDNTFTYTGAPLCIPVNTTIDHGTVTAEEVIAIALNTPVGEYTLAGPSAAGNAALIMTNCAAGTMLDVTAVGLVDVNSALDGSTVGVTKGTGELEVFAVAQLVNDESFTAVSPTLAVQVLTPDALNVESRLLVAGAQGLDGGAVAEKFNIIANKSHSIKTKYTISMR